MQWEPISGSKRRGVRLHNSRAYMRMGARPLARIRKRTIDDSDRHRQSLRPSPCTMKRGQTSKRSHAMTKAATEERVSVPESYGSGDHNARVRSIQDAFQSNTSRSLQARSSQHTGSPYGARQHQPGQIIRDRRRESSHCQAHMNLRKRVSDPVPSPRLTGPLK